MTRSALRDAGRRGTLGDMARLRTALLRRLSTLLGALLVLHAPALATWSIVVLNHKTGEVCVATATCIPNFQIRRYVPVVRVGLGGADVLCCTQCSHVRPHA